MKFKIKYILKIETIYGKKYKVLYDYTNPNEITITFPR